MTTPLDRELAERLERLAAAVPVRPGELDPVHASAVRARQQLRMRWLTPLVVLLLAAIAFLVVSNAGNDAPVASHAPDDGSGAPIGMARDGGFALTLRAAKRNYTPGEPITVLATLTYLGNQPSIEIHTDSTGPIMFGIREKVFGAIDVGGLSLLMCKTTTLRPNQPLIEPFKKGGGFDGENPDADKLKAWLLDKELRLPQGTWHLYAIAQAPCMGGDVRFDLRTEIEIVVDDDPAATPGQPVATEWQDKPVYGGDDPGNMALQVRSAHARYEVGTPIDLDTWFWFMEGDPKFARAFIPEVEFRITKVDPDADVVLANQPPKQCATTTMSRGEERHVPLDQANVVEIRSGSWPETAADALARGELLLPAGRWRITVVVRALFGPCGAPTETWETHASIEVDVIP